MNLLLADDDPDTRLLLVRALAQWGYEVETVRDGIEAWEALRRPGAPDLAIIDWRMPRLDGLQLCRRVRADAALEGKVLILLTGLPVHECFDAARSAGADDCLPKQFDLSPLRDRLAAGRRRLEHRGDAPVPSDGDPTAATWRRRERGEG